MRQLSYQADLRSETPTMSTPSDYQSSANDGQVSSVPILGEDAQALISCNQKLQELGIDHTIKLPRIVVIGDQSTGKSSLIEAISTIKVPKAANLCTKCPIAINLSNGQSHSSPWRCSVYIEEKYFFDTSFKYKKVSKSHPLGPWKERDREIVPTRIRTTEHREELCELIGIAERLLLNPRRDRSGPFEVEAAADGLEKFSPNTIRLDISMGDWPNLSFVDLPGVIQSAGKGQPDYYVDLVEALAKQYASNENNVILLTLPINHDVSNSKSYSIIQKENAQNRTMSVHTKVDLARPEERRDCLERYFNDEAEEEFQYGHHMVMLAAAGSNPSQAEDDFFSQSPWSELSPATHGRLGVRNLTTILRSILFQKTSETLPNNLEQIRIRLSNVRHELESMPEPPKALELPYELREQIHVFDSSIKQLFTSKSSSSGSSSRSRLMQLIHDFAHRIHADKPTMLIKTEAEVSGLSDAQRLLREGSYVDPVPLDSDSTSARQPIVKTKSAYRTANTDSRVHRFRLEDIRALNQKHYQSSVPGEIEPMAVQEMHQMSVQHWHKTFKEFMQTVSRVVHEEVLSTVDYSFQGQKHLAVFAEVERLVQVYLEQVISEEWTNLQKLCNAEQEHPLTLNTDAFQKAETENLAIRSQKRAETRLELARAINKAAGIGTKKKKMKEIAMEDLEPDPWNVEVIMAAKTRAYYEVAAYRFVDNISQGIFAFLIPRCHDSLVAYLKKHLGLNDIARNRPMIVALMSEDPEREAMRVRLMSEMERLKEGHVYIATALGTAQSAPRPPRSATSTLSEAVIIDADMSDNADFLPSTLAQNISSSKRKSDAYITEDESPTKRSRSGRHMYRDLRGSDRGLSSGPLVARLQSVELADQQNDE